MGDAMHMYDFLIKGWGEGGELGESGGVVWCDDGNGYERKENEV